MRILLTGVNGQVGRALRQPLEALGTVLAADRTALDLSQPQSLAPALDRLAPDLIINPAAYTAVDRAEDESELAHRVNAEAPEAMARWAAARSIPMLHFSTDYVFDGSGTRPWREDDPTGPLSVYGTSKLQGEAAIQEAAGCHLIIRTSWVFASGGRNFLTTIARLARERETLRIVADQFGAPTSARSIAQAVIAIIDAGSSAPNLGPVRRKITAAGGLVHMSNRGETSWHGFACAIVDGLRSRQLPLTVGEVVAIESHEFPVKAARPLNSRLDTTRLAQIFGVRMHDWQDALALELDHGLSQHASTNESP